MKIEKAEGGFTVDLTAREAGLLRQILQLYPLLNPDYHRLSKKPDRKLEAAQTMLEEAMAGQHRKIKADIGSLLKKLPAKGSRQFALRFDGGQMEQLLQALNDVRVGSWVQLGQPDTEHRKTFQLDDKNARYFWAMEISGLFQMEILSALNR